VPLPKAWPNERREFYLKLQVITKDNAGQFRGDPQASAYVPEWDCANLWSRNTGKAF